ncbi:MAG: hypothetical protein ACKODX_10595 [Gemmata sp.]
MLKTPRFVLVRWRLSPASARTRRATARGSVLSGAAAFALVTVAAAVALDTRLSHVRYPEHGYRLRNLNQLQAREPGQPLVVVLGSSRTQLALNPGAVEREPGSPLVFNYGLAGAHPAFLHVGYHRLRDAGVKPAAVVVEIFPALLAVTDVFAGAATVWGPQLTAAEAWRFGADAANRATVAAWLGSRLDVWSRFRSNLMFAVAPEWMTVEGQVLGREPVPDQFGYKPYFQDQVSEAERQRRLAKTSRDYSSLCRNLRVVPLVERAVRELVADCRADGVPVAFYLSPESPTFHNWYEPQARVRLAAFARALTDELGAPVFDLSGGWAEEDFADGHHMLPAATHRFSREFVARVRPWLAAARPGGGE